MTPEPWMVVNEESTVVEADDGGLEGDTSGTIFTSASLTPDFDDLGLLHGGAFVVDPLSWWAQSEETFPIQGHGPSRRWLQHSLSSAHMSGASGRFGTFEREVLSPTASMHDDPLLSAVADASAEQQQQIWRILGATHPIAEPVVQSSHQAVPSGWLEDAVSAHARPTPISLEDWYAENNESA